MDVDSLLQGIEEALVWVASNMEPSIFLEDCNTVIINDSILVLENRLLQQIVILQPLLNMEVPGINAVSRTVKYLHKGV